MRATVIDVAQLAGVSPKTVSNVVTGKVPVSAVTRAKVERALAELDYVPNLSARGLRNGRTGVIALGLPDLGTSYSAETTHHIVTVAARHGWGVQVVEAGHGSEGEAYLLSRARERLVDGLILNPVRLETSAVQTGVDLPPVVLIGEVEQPLADHVWIDNVAAAKAMTALLARPGRSRVALLGKMRSASSRLRVKGYRAALADVGVRRDAALEIGCSDWSARGGYLAMSRWLRSNEPPDALFCLTDSIALGAMHALAERGLKVPADVAVGGYDDLADSAHFTPPLTTITFDKRLFAETALELLAARIADPDGPVVVRTLDFAVVERASTAVS